MSTAIYLHIEICYKSDTSHKHIVKNRSADKNFVFYLDLSSHQQLGSIGDFSSFIDGGRSLVQDMVTNLSIMAKLTTRYGNLTALIKRFKSIQCGFYGR